MKCPGLGQKAKGNVQAYFIHITELRINEIGPGHSCVVQRYGNLRHNYASSAKWWQ